MNRLYVLLGLCMFFVFPISCSYFSYAVKDTDDKDGFETVLFLDGSSENGLEISISHLVYDSYYSIYQAKIVIIVKNPQYESTLQMNQIQMVVSNKNNNIVPLSVYKSTDEVNILFIPERIEAYSFRQDYEKKGIVSKTGNLRQEIFLEFVWKGEKHEIRKHFFLERKKHYNEFDIWMNSI
ncbi:MAG TPA: hypothetical protein DIC34_13370 [Treponema sp.]|nr:MAG: hypothetical protein A2Y36_18980 [Treponema sp. GWA1_62_8]OHE75593.1 MAG: hypothetical protein A2413_10940 [Treponema sp. RIFOXYC1_FULL_61_9]HCM27513.1 hypothetical protein [Treponema sp.]